MSDKREQAIKVLEDIVSISDKFKEDGIWAGLITIDGNKTESLRFALESLKADASDKTDRGEAIATLTEHLDHWKRLLSEGVCTKDEGERTIKALNFAIESIKALDEIVAKIDLKISKYSHFSNSNTVNGLEMAKEIVNEHRKEQE